MKKLLLIIVFWALFSLPALGDHPHGTVYVDVNGLVCDFCARALEKVFGKQEAVASITVDLDEKVITIYLNEGHSLDDEAITQMIMDSGYNVRGIRRGE